MRYSIDTSAILDGWRRHYPPDVFPGLWTRMEGLIVAGHLRASCAKAITKGSPAERLERVSTIESDRAD